MLRHYFLFGLGQVEPSDSISSSDANLLYVRIGSSNLLEGLLPISFDEVGSNFETCALFSTGL